jgi:hypothetical protein
LFDHYEERFLGLFNKWTDLSCQIMIKLIIIIFNNKYLEFTCSIKKNQNLIFLV